MKNIIISLFLLFTIISCSQRDGVLNEVYFDDPVRKKNVSKKSEVNKNYLQPIPPMNRVPTNQLYQESMNSNNQQQDIDKFSKYDHLRSVISTSGQLDSVSQESFALNIGDTVFFDVNSSNISIDSEEILINQAQWLNQNSNIQIIIEGHCDYRGTRDYNIALGSKRANTVKNYLIGLGVPSYRIDVVSYGKEKPLVAGRDSYANKKNRRAVTRLINLN